MEQAMTVAEIFQRAIRVEQDGARFYRRVAGCIADPVKAALFEEFAQMEEAHEATFSAMLGELDESAPPLPATVLDPERQGLEEWLEGDVFGFHVDLVMQLNGRETLPELLRKAIQLEKESVVFYLWLQEFVDDPVAGSRVNRIVNQEFQHITRLNRELRQLL